MIEELNKIFKKYVTVFIDEYSEYLSRDQLELLRNINFDNVIKLDSTSKPFGIISLGQVNLPNYSEELFNNLKKMANYNSNHYKLNNKNLSSYLKYMCDSGYEQFDYYLDILMYFVFKLVTKNNSGLVNGFINQEVKYLSMKYSFRFANLYPREEVITSKLSPFLGIKCYRKILFLDAATSFKYLNDNKGYHIAKFVNDIALLIDNKQEELIHKEYDGYSGFLKYTEDYDHLSYGDIYNLILDFEVENEFIK